MHLVEVARVLRAPPNTMYAVLNVLITYLSWKTTDRCNQKWGRTKQTRIQAIKRLEKNGSQADEDDEHVPS